MDLTILYEFASIRKEVHPAVYTLLGVILGAMVTLMKDWYDKKPRLFGVIVPYQSSPRLRRVTIFKAASLLAAAL